MSRKPTVYLDTNIFSVLHTRSGNKFSLEWQIKTREWWESERKFYTLVTSGQTEDELAHGYYRGRIAALAAVRRLMFLRETAEVKDCASVYLETGLIPASKYGDAMQLAFATIYRIDYLMTWNLKHLASDEVQRRVDEINKSSGWRSPLLVSPGTIPWATLGQNIRRKDE